MQSPNEIVGMAIEDLKMTEKSAAADEADIRLEKGFPDEQSELKAVIE